MRPLALIALTAGLLGATAASADPVDDLVGEFMQASHIPGVAIAVIEDGEIVRLQGYGVASLEWDAPVTPDTPFQTASVSKIFAGVVLMRMVEAGRVSLDDPISRFFEDAPDSWDAITVRHLAGHMSGLPEGLGQPGSATAQEVAAAAMTRPLAYEPGSESRYGFTDFVVMTAILEQVSGLTYPELLRREVIEPLGLTHTGFPMTREAGAVRSSEIMPGRARVYGYSDGVLRDEEWLYPVHAYAAGGLFTSARDLAVLMAALERGELLGAESFALLTSPVQLNDGRPGSFGVGWTFDRYRGLETVGHTGGPALADVMHIPAEGLTVIALTNQRRFYPLLSHAIADLELGPAPLQPAIADGRPELTANLRAMLEAAAGGVVEAERFSERGQQAVVPFYRDFGQAMLTAVGTVEDVELLSERTLEDGRLRRLYRVAFERRTLLMAVRTTADGLIDDAMPLSGDDPAP